VTAELDCSELFDVISSCVRSSCEVKCLLRARDFTAALSTPVTR